jgi:hypothetical protein
MENLIYDVQSNILKFMTTTDMINLMNSSENAKLMFKDLSTHIGFIIYCDTIISDEQIEMFNSNNIKYKLLETIDDSMYYDNVSYFRNGKLHRDNDLPAVINANGDKYWYKNGFKHRDNDLPAIIHNDCGEKIWYKDGLIHRDNYLPAITYSSGSRYWYKYGLLHRDNDLPAVIYYDGNKIWYKDGKQIIKKNI